MAWTFDVSPGRGDRFIAWDVGRTGQTLGWSQEDTPPAYQGTIATFLVEMVRIRLTTSANVGNRRPILRMYRSAVPSEIIALPAQATQGASVTDGRFEWGFGLPVGAASVNVVREAMPRLPLLTSEFYLDVTIVGVLAGDVLNEATIWGSLEPRGAG